MVVATWRSDRHREFRRVAHLNRSHVMANPPGSFIWYELMTPDPDNATSFYRAVVGWTIGPADPGRTDGMDYRMIGRSDGKHAGGVLRTTDDMRRNGARPLWLGYLYVPDAKASIAAIV